MTEQEKQNLVTSLNQLLADTAVFRHKAHVYHWNVTGLLFGQLHDQFEEIYDDLLEDDFDATAEQIRALGERPYAGLDKLSEESILQDANVANDPDAADMIRELYEDNERILAIIKETERVAENAGAQGVLDFVNGRHATHNMVRYKLGSYLGGPTDPVDE